MSNVTYDDFAKLDIRVAKIIATEPIEGKSKIGRASCRERVLCVV